MIGSDKCDGGSNTRQIAVFKSNQKCGRTRIDGFQPDARFLGSHLRTDCLEALTSRVAYC